MALLTRLAFAAPVPSCRRYSRRDPRALINNLAAVELEYCDRNMIARVIKDAGHSQFLCYDAGTHLGLLQLDLHVDAGRKIELHQRVYGLRGRVDDIEQTFVGADFKLLTRLLVHMR